MTSTEGRRDVLDDLAALGPFFAVETHPPGSGPTAPWRLLRELTATAGPLRTRIEAVRAALAERAGRPAEAIEPRVAASVAHLGLVARLIAPSVAAAAAGRGLGMGLGEVWWQDTLGGAMPLSVPFPDATAGDPALVADLLEEVIAPLTVAVSNLVTVSPQVLWGNVASAASKAAALVAARHPELSRPAWTAAGAVFATPWLSRERQPPGPDFRRSSCCLIYKVAAGRPRSVCSDCVLRQV